MEIKKEKKITEQKTTTTNVVTQELKKDIRTWNEGEGAVYLGKEYKNDSVMLGKKKTWKPSNPQKEKNKKIEESQKLTKLATEDTLDLKDTITALNKVRQNTNKMYDEAKMDRKVLTEGRISFIESFKLEKKMLTSANIRAHFSEYLNLVNTYQDLKETEEGRERLKKAAEPMEILTKRLKCYLEQNRLTLDGRVLDDNVEAETFVYTEEIDSYFEKTRKKTGKEFDPEAILANKNMEKSAALSKPVSEMTSVERIASIGPMSELLKEKEKEAAELDEGWKKALDLDTIRDLKEQSAKTKNEIFELKACLSLAKAEEKFMLCEKDEEREELKKEAEAAYKDYMRVLARIGKEKLPLVTGNDKRLTREQAMNTESDLANYEFKYKLRETAEGLPSENEAQKQLKEALLKYTDVTHYSVGSQKEYDLLKKVIKLRKSGDLARTPGLEKIDKMLSELQNGANDFPDWKNIPDSLKMDCVSGKGKGIIPKEADASKEKGSYRNALLTSTVARTWQTLDPDTPLFAHEPTINDLRQGKVSNCYMIASTTSLINYDPQLIKKCIHDNGDGSVTVRLFKPSERAGGQRVPFFVRIPKAIPKLRLGGEILSSGALWMQLIERAAAQVGMFRKDRQGYQSLWYGNGDEWLMLLTGSSRNIIDDRSDALFDEIMHAKEKGRIYHAGSKNDPGEGLNGGHAYTVLGAEVINGEKYIVLRNPYANMSRVEDENKKVSLSTTFLSSTADETQGQFTIPFKEFVEKMDKITLTEMNEAFKPEIDKSGEEKNLNQIAEEELAAKKAKEGTKGIMDEEDMDSIEEDIKAALKEKETEKKESEKEEKTEETEEEKKEEKKEKEEKEDEEVSSANSSLGNIDDWIEEL